MRSVVRFAAFVLVLTTGAIAAPFATAAAPYTEHVLKNLCEARHCPPAHPTSGLLLGDDGTLYGVASGDVFAMTPDGSGGWTYQVIATGVAAANSRSPLVRDTAGNLYGTGGDQIFRLTPNADRTSWTAQVLTTFCTKTNCPDGEGLYGGLSYAGSASGAPYDGTSPLYGTAARGGAHGNSNTGGVVYSLTPGAGDVWTKKTLYDFCALANCADGVTPLGGVVMDGSGSLYGTTSQGGIAFHTSTGGTVFKLTRTGSGWSQSVLYDFCTKRTRTNCVDGATPIAGVVLDGAGNIFGNTQFGGANFNGAAFRMNPKNGSYSLHTIYDFSAGAQPLSPMTPGPSGEFYGTTWKDGGNDAGTAYRLSLQSGAWTQSTLYTFCTASKCKDGAQPVFSTLLLDDAGNLFGTTSNGGKHNGGTVFELSP